MSINEKLLKGAVAVLFGGESAEREVSLQSGKAVIDAFKQLGLAVEAIDVKTKDLSSTLLDKKIKHCFIALHGGAGENGQVQALLECLNITYTGSGVMGCAIAMDKRRTKLLWKGAGIPTADFMLVNQATKWDEVSSRLGSKMMLKPSSEGSSIGMSVVDSETSFYEALTLALKYDADVIAEKWLNGAEYTVAILNNKALPMIRLKTENRFYDYEAKYISNDTQYLCPCGLSEEIEAKIQAVASHAFELLGWSILFA
jgi:D-alanine-D-alanine ligase